ncbi:SdiA-regulated domain-containing protein [Cyanobium sp. FGCU-6]|nr:SdiA-regulated domain-containing protein [Cyanobium sp. FGCU6]
MLVSFALGCGLTAAAFSFPRRFLNYWLITPSTGEHHPSHAVVVAGKPLQGVEKNISGLTYSEATNTLFAVTNRPERVIELDLCGKVLRVLPTAFGDDLEAISHVTGDLFVIASENGNVIWGAQIDRQTREVGPLTTHTLSVSLNGDDNQGIEGLSWDHRGRRLFLANEKNPLQIVEVKGFDRLMLGRPASVALAIWRQHPSLGSLAGDVSSISFNERWGSMMLLSHESRRVYRFDPGRDPSLILHLERGKHGLLERVDQPEGLAFGPDGTVFIVAEPNLFYRFEPLGDAAASRSPTC